jgi:zinc/manganese transport system permease protein
MSADVLLVFLPAFVGGGLVVLTHVPLGREVLRSGIVFLDLAIAQAAGFGVVFVGARLQVAAGAPLLQLAAVAAALAAAALLAWTEKRVGVLQEAVIGSLFVLAACAGLLALASNPHAGERLQDLLVGQILWTTWRAIIPVAILYAGAMAAWTWMRPRFGRFAFYAIFALVVTASVQLVGIYLVFASLILPAIAAFRLPGRKGLALGYAVGSAGYFAGFLLAMLFDLPAGPVIVWTLAAAALAGGLISLRMRDPANAA